jgi:hypothetical protein
MKNNKTDKIAAIKDTLNKIRQEEIEAKETSEIDSYQYKMATCLIHEVNIILTRLDEISEDNFHNSFILFFRGTIIRNLEHETTMKDEAKYIVYKELLVAHYKDSWLYKLFE